MRQFAVAMVGTAGCGVNKVWEWAVKLVDADPSNKLGGE